MTIRPPFALALLYVGLMPLACAQRPPKLADIPLEYAEFVVQRGDSVVATERTTRSLDRLEGEIEVPGRARATYVATLGGPGTVMRLEAVLRPWTGDTPPAQLAVDLLADSVRVTSSRWEGVGQRFAGRATNVYLHPSPALLELILRQAMLSRDSTVEVGVWLANQNARSLARVSFTGGQTHIELAGTRVRLLHEDGYIMLGEVPALGWVFSRRTRR